MRAEKQKTKRIYGVFEKQFRNLYEEANRQKGVTGETLLRMLELRLQLQASNLETSLGTSLRPGLTVKQAAERYSALLSPELYHLLTVDHRWTTPRYASWVRDLLDHDLLG